MDRAERVFASIVVALGVLVGGSSRANAACVDGQPVTNDCAIDLVTSPILSSNRVVALGGAYQAIASGLDGYPQNAASPAVRDPWSHKWLDYDLGASITFPTAFRNIDFENRGYVTSFTYNDFVFLTLGANLQLGAWGFGFFSDLQSYNLTPNVDASQPSYGAVVSKTHVLLARQLFSGNLVVGAGVRIVGFQMNRKGGGQPDATVVSLTGGGGEIGVLWRPNEQSFRIGATYRAPVIGNPGPNDTSMVNGSVIPHSANLPWEIDAGIALQAGPHPLDDPWINPHDVEADVREGIRRARARRDAERNEVLAATPPEKRKAKEQELERNEEAMRQREDRELKDFQETWYAKRKLRWSAMAREYLLFSVGLLVTGPTTDGISLESFFSQKVTRAGRLTTFSPRAGLETELVPNYVKARLGGYVEPTRFGSQPDAKAFRQHVTLGGDLYLFQWRVFGLFEEGTAWRLTLALDLAPRYQSYGISIGNWH